LSCSGWKEVKLGEAPIEIIDGDRGKNYPKGFEFMDHGFCLFLNAKNVTSSGFSFQEKMFISREKDFLLRKGKLQRHDIVLTTRGTVGNVGYFSDEISFTDIRINSGMVILRCSKKHVMPEFAYWLFRSPFIQSQIYSLKSGSAQPQLPISIMKNITLLLPPLNIQEAIVKVVSCLDDKIELNNRINKTLEEMAQAIFKSWFVDFEPFQDGEFEDSELGPIPKGWRVKSLGDLCDLQKGLSYKGKFLSEEGDPMINLGNVQPGGEYRYDKIKYYNGDYKDRHVVIPGDIIIANTDMTSDRAILGSPIFVPNYPGKDIIFSHHLFAVKRLNVPKTFLYYFFKSASFRERAEGYANGTTVLALSRDDLMNLKLIVPDEKVVSSFDSITDKIVRLKEKKSEENKRLEETRDTLLPKLMSGEIRVPFEEVY